VAAGVSNVLALAPDPNPLVSGQGLAKLQAAGVQAQLLDLTHEPFKALHDEARALNVGFFSRMERGTPWVRLKIAASLDGQTALQNGQSQWITSEAARADGHAWRARACAVLTGIGTVLQDNPRLDVREVPTPRQPHVVVVDSRLELPLNAKLLDNLKTSGREVWVYHAVPQTLQQAAPFAAKQAALEALGVKLVHCPQANTSAAKVDLQAMLQDLARREVNELHVEAGHKLNGSLVREQLVDEFLVYLAPKLLGQGQGMLQLGPFTELLQAPNLEFTDVQRIGPDVRLMAKIVKMGGKAP
jgi:diaminohydroxyphosphoribosylaminopyrimidine deaminase/5-amino-6-(5-phosphoribosylamino)uracil reductase